MRDITIDNGLTVARVEASAVHYLQDVSLYIVVSDDTDKKRPQLFYMNDEGHISQKTMVEGLDKINDMEGITRDGHGLFYILASQSFNKNGEQSFDRKQFVRMKRQGTLFILDKSVALADCLLAAAAEAGTVAWADFVRRGSSDKSIDIEGITWMRDTLLLGFKNPKLGNDAVILAISDPDALFDRGRLTKDQVSLWRTLTLCDQATGTFCGVSDLCFHNDVLFGVSTGVFSRSGVEKDVGLFWQYAPATGAMKIVSSFPGLKPEGLAFNRITDEFCIVFDNGSRNPSQLLTVKVSQ